jgi:ribosome-binding protein aMBF1 (putative translation factor)
MAKSFSTLREKMAPERRLKVATRTQELLADLPLQEIRLARQLSQEEVARKLNVNQAAVSKVEHRADLYISTLRKHIEAMGGVLVLHAEFPEGRYQINSLGGLDSE